MDIERLFRRNNRRRRLRIRPRQNLLVSHLHLHQMHDTHRRKSGAIVHDSKCRQRLIPHLQRMLSIQLPPKDIGMQIVLEVGYTSHSSSRHRYHFSRRTRVVDKVLLSAIHRESMSVERGRGTGLYEEGSRDVYESVDGGMLSCAISVE